MFGKILFGFACLVLNLNPSFVGSMNLTKQPVVQEQVNEEKIEQNQMSKEDRAKSFGDLVSAYIKGRGAYSTEVYDLLIEHVGPDYKVLDVGCGTGIATRSLSARFKDVHGCDHDEKMLEAAKNSSPDRISFEMGSAYQLPYQDGEFGLVTMFSSFHWFCDAKAMQEISRVLQKDGFVYVVGKTPSGFSEEIRKIEDDAVGYKILRARDGYEPGKMLTENGFVILENQEFISMKTCTVEEALQKVQSMSSWNDVKKAGKEQEVLDQIKECLAKQVDPKDGLLHYEVSERVILAQKNS